MASPRTVIVTGANRGIGHAICQTILSRSDLAPVNLYAASRSGNDLGFAPTSNNKVFYPKLDIADHGSVRAFADKVAAESGSVDVLINNAAVFLNQEYGVQSVKRVLDVNYRGTKDMCEAFLPLMNTKSSNKPRIVNVSSMASSLSHQGDAVAKRFRDPKLSIAELDNVAQDYEQAVKTGTETKAGFIFPPHSYAVSKVLVNGLTMVLARENPSVLLSCCCPGWVATDMGRLSGSPSKTPEQGAAVPVHLAFDDSVKDLTGVYWAGGSASNRWAGTEHKWL